jgi:Fe-S-cluster-containing dehydrogenase component
MREEFIDLEVGKKEPQCIAVCPKEAIALKNVEQIGEETRIEAVKRLFAEQLADIK